MRIFRQFRKGQCLFDEDTLANNIIFIHEGSIGLYQSKTRFTKENLNQKIQYKKAKVFRKLFEDFCSKIIIDRINGKKLTA